MAYEQIDTLIGVDQHVVTMKDSKTSWDGSWKNDPFGKENGIGVAEGVISLVDFSRAAGNVPFLFERHSAAPTADDIDDYDGVLEASIHLPSRKLSVENESGSAGTLSVPSVPGDLWRVRAYYGNGDTARNDYSDGAEHVRLAMFPGPAAPIDVLKPHTLEGDVVREYAGKRSDSELKAMFAGINLSHRCLATVALLQKGGLASVMAAASQTGAVRRVFASTVWFAGAPAEKILADLVKDADPDIRTRAAQSIGFLKAQGLKKVLESLQKDKNEQVREAAEGALSDLSEE